MHDHRTIARRDHMALILYVLARHSEGRASAVEVLDEMGRILSPDLSPIDRERLSSGEPRWRNNARWARNQLVYEGCLLPTGVVGFAIWALSPKGRSEAAPIRPAVGGGQGGERPKGDQPAHPTTRFTPLRRMPSVGDWLDELAWVIDRVDDAGSAAGANSAGGDLVASFERLLDSIMAPAVPPSGGTPSEGASPVSRGGSAAPARHPRSPPTPTTRTSSGPLDLARIEDFIRRSSSNLATLCGRQPFDWVQADRVASLPMLQTLLAWRHCWGPRSELARLTVRAAFEALGGPRRRDLRLGARFTDQLDTVAVRALRGGLLHHTLTTWVHELDGEPSPETLLYAGCLRAWVDDLRGAVGTPSSWRATRLHAALAARLTDEVEIAAPTEEDVGDLELFLADASAEDFKWSTPPRGTLLWNKELGWGVSLGQEPISRQKPLQVFVVSRGMAVSIHRDRSVWVRLDEPSFRSTLPADCVGLVERIGERARAAGGTAQESVRLSTPLRS